MLKIADRVVVTVPHGRKTKTYTGIIIGESRDGHAWHLIKDGTTWSRGIHKSFCQPEKVDGEETL